MDGKSSPFNKNSEINDLIAQFNGDKDKMLAMG